MPLYWFVVPLRQFQFKVCCFSIAKCIVKKVRRCFSLFWESYQSRKDTKSAWRHARFMVDLPPPSHSIKWHAGRMPIFSLQPSYPVFHATYFMNEPLCPPILQVIRKGVVWESILKTIKDNMPAFSPQGSRINSMLIDEVRESVFVVISYLASAVWLQPISGDETCTRGFSPLTTKCCCVFENFHL